MDVTVASPLGGALCLVTADSSSAGLSALKRSWTEARHLKLTNHGNWPVEFNHGHLETLCTMSTQRHQAAVRFPFPALLPFVRDIGCEVFFAPLRVRIRDGKFREPDPLLVRDADDRRCRDEYWLGADLVMVVRPEDSDRELVEKRFDYAEAGIPE